MSEPSPGGVGYAGAAAAHRQPGRVPGGGAGAAPATLPRRESLVHSPILWRRRQRLTLALGLLWLLDAALQYQPYMFTSDFPRLVIAPAGQGSPGWVDAPVNWAAHLMAANPGVFNALFATVQLAIAVGLFWRATVKLALAASIFWALLVWWLGEGLGGVLAGPASPIMGLPGAAILYAFAAALLWPRPAEEAARAGSAAAASPLRPAGAKLSWLLLWAAFAYEALLPAARAPSGLHDLISGMAAGEPRWIADINTTAGAFFAHQGTTASIALAGICALVGLSVLIPATTRPGLTLAVVLALAIWVIGEDFGQIATGTATDPDSGLPLALLALCYWPITTNHDRAQATPPARGPDKTDRERATEDGNHPVAIEPAGNRRAGSRRTPSARRSRAKETNMRVRAAVVPALLAVLLAGCGAGAGETAQHLTGQPKVPVGMHRMPDGTLMSDSDMAGMDMGSMAHAAQPSAAAKMICSDETHESLQHNLGLAALPQSTSRWAGGIYTCTYHLSGGDLVVSVQDATDEAAGRQYFDAVQAQLPGLKPINGMESFGLLGYENVAGIVLFLKDGKTLDVDATALPAKVGRYHQTPADVAYGLAAAILACWSEH